MPLHLDTRLSIAVLIAATAACSARAEGPDAGPPSLEIGTGTRGFETLSDGDSIFIVQGPQGGYHFFGSLRAQNIDPGDSEDLSDPQNPQTTFEAFVEDIRVDAMASSYRQGLEATGGFAQMVGRQVILDILDDEELDGITVRFSVAIEDAAGVQLHDERTLTAIKHPDNQ